MVQLDQLEAMTISCGTELGKNGHKVIIYGKRQKCMYVWTQRFFIIGFPVVKLWSMTTHITKVPPLRRWLE